jgi:hypothetical protein
MAHDVGCILLVRLLLCYVICIICDVYTLYLQYIAGFFYRIPAASDPRMGNDVDINLTLEEVMRLLTYAHAAVFLHFQCLASGGTQKTIDETISKLKARTRPRASEDNSVYSYRESFSTC